MLLRYYCLLQSRGREMWDYFCYAAFISEKSSSSPSCLCLQGEERRVWMKGSVRAGASWRIYLVIPWSRLPSAEQINFIFLWQEPLPQCQCDSKHLYQLWNWLLWPYRWYICWPSLFNICSANKELLAGLKAKGSGLAVVCWKMMCAHPRRKHHFRNFQFLHHPPPSELSF